MALVGILKGHQLSQNLGAIIDFLDAILGAYRLNQ